MVLWLVRGSALGSSHDRKSIYMQVQEPLLLNHVIQYITLGLQKEICATELHFRMFSPLSLDVQKRACGVPSAREQNKLRSTFVVVLLCHTIGDRLIERKISRHVFRTYSFRI
jgi:hypothetical protein